MATRNSDQQLHFHEEIMLLALREDDGKVEGKAQFEFKHLIAAALLSELVLTDRISVSDQKKAVVDLKSTQPLGNELLDAALQKIADSKAKAASHWISAFQSIPNFLGKATESLCNRGILAAEDGKVFFFFDKTYYPELNPRPEQQLIERLRKAIFSDAKDIDERTLVLLALLRKSEILKIPFEAQALKERRHHMKALCEGDVVGAEARKAVETAQTAVFIATMVPIFTATTVVS